MNFILNFLSFILLTNLLLITNLLILYMINTIVNTIIISSIAVVVVVVVVVALAIIVIIVIISNMTSRTLLIISIFSILLQSITHLLRIFLSALQLVVMLQLRLFRCQCLLHITLIIQQFVHVLLALQNIFDFFSCKFVIIAWHVLLQCLRSIGSLLDVLTLVTFLAFLVVQLIKFVELLSLLVGSFINTRLRY